MSRISGTRERILDAFTASVADHGYERTSIGDVAATVGVSKGAVLYHFASKDVLLKQMGLDYIGRRFAEVERAVARLDGPADQLAAVIYSTVVGLRDDGAAARAFGREFVLFKADARLEPVRIRRDEYAAVVLEIIRRCIDDGTIVDHEPRLAMLQLFGMCNWAWTWYRPDGDRSAEQLAERFTITLLRGLGPGGNGAAFDPERVLAALEDRPPVPAR